MNEPREPFQVDYNAWEIWPTKALRNSPPTVAVTAVALGGASYIAGKILTTQAQGPPLLGALAIAAGLLLFAVVAWKGRGANAENSKAARPPPEP